MTRGRGIGVLIAFVVSAVAASPARAQTDPRLLATVRLAQEGHSDSARASIRRLLAETPVSDSLYPQILYTAAMIAPSTQEMQRYLQRVAVEYSSSEWVDESRLRLAQIDYANGDLAGAARTLERIRTDYPSSPLFPVAAHWAARAYFGLNDKPAACGWVAEGLPRVGDDLELKNQLEVYSRRCEGVTPAGPSIRVAAVPPPARAVYRVQIAAVSSQASADAAVRSLTRLGYRSQTMRENGLLKVRAGEYASRAEAAEAAADLKAKLRGTPFVVADP